ncbi:MAG TPA: efflux RND transporter permease subunit [Candidatus Eisenbacteria bacterium]|jgi:multidrug efflux pump subunit AcrB
MIALFRQLHRQRPAIAFLFAVLVVLGIAAGLGLPAGLLPEVTFPRITVIADSGERPGDEMMRSVTRPLEESIRRVPGVREIRSTTSRGSCEINLDCAWNTDMNLTLQRVQAQAQLALGALPPGTTVDARLMNPILFPVVGYSMTSNSKSLAELRDLAVMVLKPELARIPGVAEVAIQGGRTLEARVTLDPGLLQARGLDAATVATALRSAGEIESVGLIDANRELYLGLVNARPPDLAALEQFPIPVIGAPPVPLSSLGRVSLEEAPEFVRYRAQGREAVLISLLRRPSSSLIRISSDARRWFAEHRRLLPSDVKLEAFYDQSDLVRASVKSVQDSLLAGAILAFFVVALFLGSLRLGLGGAVVLPCSIAMTLLGLALAHQTLNMMTLGGIAAAVGLVLDDAIVVVEHLAHRAASAGAAFDRFAAIAEIFPSMVGSSLCTIAIFIPFMFLSGVTGAFFKVLALAMTLMLGSSLLVCVTVVPLLSHAHAPRRPTQSRARQRLAAWLGAGTVRPWPAFLALGLLIAGIFPLLASLGTGFLPEMDEGSLILDFLSPPGTSASETERMLSGVERDIAATPEIAAWSGRIGDQLGFFITEPNRGDYVLRLKERPRRGAEDIIDHLRDRIQGSQPGLEIEFGQLIEDVVGDLTTNPQPIEVRVFGEDHSLLQAQAGRVASILERVPGVVDVKSGVVVSGSNVSIVPGLEAARAGLSAETLSEVVTPAVAGLSAGQIVRGVRAWPVRVVLDQPSSASATQRLIQTPVPVAPGRWVPLGNLARLDVEPGETEIARDDLRTMVSVTARLSGRDLGSAMAEVQRRIREEVALPPGMAIRYGGLWAEQQESFRGLAAVLLGATAAVLLILLLSFRSWRHTGSVIAVVVASLAGVFAALHVGGATFNISSFVGAIMVVGIVAENAFFVVAAHRAAAARGATPPQAAAAAARRRARPVLMTTAAGVAALAPLALGLGAGSALLKPLALAVVGGFVLSAPLLLLVLPALLACSGGPAGSDGAEPQRPIPPPNPYPSDARLAGPAGR